MLRFKPWCLPLIFFVFSGCTYRGWKTTVVQDEEVVVDIEKVKVEYVFFKREIHIGKDGCLRKVDKRTGVFRVEWFKDKVEHGKQYGECIQFVLRYTF